MSERNPLAHARGHVTRSWWRDTRAVRKCPVERPRISFGIGALVARDCLQTIIPCHRLSCPLHPMGFCRRRPGARSPSWVKTWTLWRTRLSIRSAKLRERRPLGTTGANSAGTIKARVTEDTWARHKSTERNHGRGRPCHGPENSGKNRRGGRNAPAKNAGPGRGRRFRFPF